MRMNGIAALIAGGLCIGVCQASFINTEPANDAMGGADALGLFGPGGALIFDSKLETGGGDVDWFALTVSTPSPLHFVTITVGLDLLPGTPDPVLGAFDSAGTELAFNDDLSGTSASGIVLFNVTSGTYFLAVSGTGDRHFTGAHSEEGFYQMLIGLTVPTPGTAILAGLGGMMLVVPRRQRRG